MRETERDEVRERVERSALVDTVQGGLLRKNVLGPQEKTRGVKQGNLTYTDSEVNKKWPDREEQQVRQAESQLLCLIPR